MQEPHRQVGMGRVVTSGSLCGEVIRTLVWNARDVGLIPALGAMFLIFVTPTTLAAMTMCKVRIGWLLNLPVCIYMCDHFLYVSNCEL